jgi:hypothetical protein
MAMMTDAEIRRLRQSIADLKREISDLTPAFNELDISEQLKASSAALTETIRRMRQLKIARDEAISAGDATGEAALNDAINKLSVSVDGLRASSAAGAVKIKEFIEEIAGAGAVLEDLNENQLKDLNTRFKQFSKETAEGAARATTLKNRLLGLSGAANDLATMVPKTSNGFAGFTQNLKLSDLAGGLLTKTIGLFVNQTIGLAKAQDADISSFRRSTGATSEYNTEITQIERRNFAAGVSAQEAGAAFNTLFTEFSAFTQMSPGARAALSDTTALLSELGVSAGTTAAILDKTTRATGMSAEQGRDLLLDLAGTAHDLGDPISKLAGDFERSFGALAKYGTQAIDVFKGLEVQAKNSGLAVDQLINIAGKFDQFDSAGQAVGRLNAILGGPYLNSIDMLNATEEERIEILRRSTDAAGIQFDALNRFEQQAIAAAMGTSVEEAQRLFNMSEEQYALDAMKQQELQELAQETQEIGQQLKSAFMGLAVDLRPIIDVFVVLVKQVSKFFGFIGKITNGMYGFIKVGMMAAGIAALLGAPFTGGASILTYAAIVGSAAGAGMATGLDTGEVTPAFQNGGTVTTKQAIVHPGEILLTGGQGSEVISKEDFKSLVDTLKEFTSGGGGPQQIAVYVGQEKIDDIVVKALDSPRAKGVFSPFSNG